MIAGAKELKGHIRVATNGSATWWLIYQSAMFCIAQASAGDNLLLYF